MAELVDALASGASGGNSVEVQVLFWAPDTYTLFRNYLIAYIRANSDFLYS